VRRQEQLCGTRTVCGSREITDQIDKMMTPFRESNPEFFRGYLSARVIVDRRATHAAPKKPPPTPVQPPP